MYSIYKILQNINICTYKIFLLYDLIKINSSKLLKYYFRTQINFETFLLSRSINSTKIYLKQILILFHLELFFFKVIIF